MNRRQQIERARDQAADAVSGAVVTADELEQETVPPVIVPERFVIDDAPKASWVVRKIVEARKYGERVQQWCERELHRAEQEEEWLLRRFGVELEAWAKGELERTGGRRRSLNLPGGAVGFRMQPARVEVLDEQAVLTWCRSQLPIALKVTVEANDQHGLELLRWQAQHAEDSRLRQYVLREALNRHVQETGELPDGAGVRPAADQFYVR
jgi:hypothetical protein